MTTPVRFLVVGTALFACGAWFLAATERSNAADLKKTWESVLKVADLMEKQDFDGAKKQAAAIANAKGFELKNVMSMFKLRTQEGYGIGAKAGTIKPDGIEAMLLNMTKQPPSKKVLETQSAELARAFYISAAIAEIAMEKCPVKNQVKEKDGTVKDPAQWKQWMEDAKKYSLELAEAIKTKDPKDPKDPKRDPKTMKETAKKLDTACQACHGPFKPKF